MLKLLAKLRQYNKGSVEEYLKNEHRQNLIAIEQALGSIQTTQTQVQQIAAPQVVAGVDVFHASYNSSFSGVLPISANNTVISGSLSGNTYLPPVDGDYWVEFGCKDSHSTGSNVFDNRTTISAIAGTTYSFSSIYSQNGSGIVNLNPQQTVKIKIPLTTTTGIYFSGSPTLGSPTLSQFYCKITKA